MLALNARPDPVGIVPAQTAIIVVDMQTFQQTQIADAEGYNDQFGRDAGNWTNDDQSRFVRAAEESFARTTLALMSRALSPVTTI